MIVYYDRELCDWDAVLEKAWASRQAGETGTVICLPRPSRKNAGHTSARQQQVELFEKES